MLSEGRSQFADPKSDKDVVDTKYCMHLWNEWKMYRNSLATDETTPDDITEMSKETSQYWMCCFVLDVRKRMAVCILLILYITFAVE